MSNLWTKQKIALTRAVNSKDPEKVLATCRAAVATWRKTGMWPDDWSHWQRALDDTRPFFEGISLEDL